jgi:hypothetical protein
MNLGKRSPGRPNRRWGSTPKVEAHAPQKSWKPHSSLHGVTTQKITIKIITVVSSHKCEYVITSRDCLQHVFLFDDLMHHNSIICVFLSSLSGSSQWRTVMKLRVPQKTRNNLASWSAISAPVSWSVRLSHHSFAPRQSPRSATCPEPDLHVLGVQWCEVMTLGPACSTKGQR